eukprot:1161306-Pelagomonas_calceolata.AAC.3
MLPHSGSLQPCQHAHLVKKHTPFQYTHPDVTTLRVTAALSAHSPWEHTHFFTRPDTTLKAIAALSAHSPLKHRVHTLTLILTHSGLLQPTQRPITPQQAQHALLDNRGGKSGEDTPRGSVDLLRANLDTRQQSVTPPKGQQRGPIVASALGLQPAKEVRTRLWDLIDPHWCGKVGVASVTSALGLLPAKEVRTRLWDLIDPCWCGKVTSLLVAAAAAVCVCVCV